MMAWQRPLGVVADGTTGSVRPAKAGHVIPWNLPSCKVDIHTCLHALVWASERAAQHIAALQPQRLPRIMQAFQAALEGGRKLAPVQQIATLHLGERKQVVGRGRVCEQTELGNRILGC